MAAIAPQGTTSSNVVEFPVTINLNSASNVRLGASASVSITTGSKDNVLEVPSAAITTLGQIHTVSVQHGTTYTTTPVQIGLVGTSTTEITSGVSEGDVLRLPTSSSSASTSFPSFGGGGLGAGRLG